MFPNMAKETLSSPLLLGARLALPLVSPFWGALSLIAQPYELIL
jgi:hypothetical protein